jgi:hypothetical protein
MVSGKASKEDIRKYALNKFLIYIEHFFESRCEDYVYKCEKLLLNKPNKQLKILKLYEKAVKYLKYTKELIISVNELFNASFSIEEVNTLSKQIQDIYHKIASLYLD